MHKTLLLILIQSSLLFSGCSTVITHTDDSITPTPYSGTRRATDKTLRSLKKYDYYGEFFIRAIDIPLSFISDTVILPYDLYQQIDK